MHVGFPSLSFKSCNRVFYSFQCNEKLAGQVKQNALPLFCDEGVFQILVDIFLQKQDQLQKLIPILGR